MKQVAVPECPLCRNTGRDYLYSGIEHEYDNTTDETFHFYRCRDCSLVYLDPRPDESELPTIYPPNYYSRKSLLASPALATDSSLGTRIFSRRFLNRFRRNLGGHVQLGPGHSYLDIGCGGGFHLGHIHSAYGCECTGIDFEMSDANLRDFSSPPITLLRGDFLTHDFGGRQFDVVYASHLIEHLSDPVTFFERVSAVLKPGGLCIIETPNEMCFTRKLFGPDWGGNHIPRHWFLMKPGQTRVPWQSAIRNLGCA